MPRNFIIIIGVTVVLFLLLVAGVIFLWWPEYQNLSALKITLDNKKIELKQKEDYFVNLKKIKDKLEDYSQELAKIDSALPSDSSIPYLFYVIQQASAENGLSLKSVALKGTTATEEGKIQNISFAVNVLGSYSALKNFLSSLYQNGRFIDVDSVDFISAEKTSDSFSFNISLTTYGYQKVEKTASGQSPK